MSRNSISKFIFEASGILVLAFFLLGPAAFMAGDPGLGWHLKTGEWIVANASIPSSDPFLFSSVGKSWVCNQWLSDVVLWLTYKYGGWALLSLLAVLPGIIGFWLFLPRCYGQGKVELLPVFVSTLLCAVVASMQWYIRPVVFSFLLFMAVYVIVRRLLLWPGGNATRFVLLPLLFILWANIHPGFPYGLLVVLAGAVSSLLSVKDWKIFASWCACFLLCLLATFVNPFGPGLHQSMLALVGSQYFMQLNVEWLPPTLEASIFWPFYLLATALVLVALVSKAKQLLWFDVLLCVGFAVLGLTQRRSIPFFGMVACVPFALSLHHALACTCPETIGRYLGKYELSVGEVSRRLSIAIALVVAVVAIGGGLGSNELSMDARYPSAIVEELNKDGGAGRVFASPDFGGYLIFSLKGDSRVFIDDRNELNGESLYLDYFNIVGAKQGWEKLLVSYDFEWLILKSTDNLSRELKGNKIWSLVKQDSEVVLYRRAML